MVRVRTYSKGGSGDSPTCPTTAEREWVLPKTGHCWSKRIWKLNRGASFLEGKPELPIFGTSMNWWSASDRKLQISQNSSRESDPGNILNPVNVVLAAWNAVPALIPDFGR